ncbi:hypothetical protein [Lacticaseibacillus manihotivorans]|uniref:DUF2922 domain-containing protein n=2 Tax=Lacticaseibacillus manihotivorans TaxID=88233 RepID=A0A0R1QC21_9LACO|nr:hypothetical protein [Lacticaseibacillus manihotivorans]KRL42191.1 hypothetical protein FD01_GL001941 [Lacticaseibacillus manihotivorans DSM 13343 = JCM 12514]QFQ91906.1 hypothetical protein LM010_10935 [Lacticaseibacillus manihotivorans]
MNNYVISLVYTNGANVKNTFRISGLTKEITEINALQALQQLPEIGGFVDATGEALFVNPIEADVTQTIKTIYKL